MSKGRLKDRFGLSDDLWRMQPIDIDGKETISHFAVAKENHVFC
ncbi:hypothetical protein MCC93_08770 [Morococcus cerebrosus]|uniref:Uncharacterized protein n=1 Tax=Morococcus cerebrosus TaxID=1056807 RepID=A0A0C1EL78_9NEIS|nr:hypothetical protein MCC93_08770 [Morococcus cerebrosus]